MKKQITTLFLMAATVTMTTLFTACGEEVNTDDPKPTGPTEFITEASDGTRTSMDDERYFYWEPTDNIYINTSGTTWVRSDDNTIEGNAQASCKFIFNSTFTNAGYPVVYTGNDTTATSATEVKIAPVQKQSVWNNAEHFGESGDCGTATAAQQANGTYKFSLRHQAAYLKLQPYYDNTNMPGSYKLQKIEITTRKNTTTLSGTYDFTHANGLAATPKTAAETDTIVTLHCGGSGFQLGTSALNSIFVVIHPNASGEKHAISMKYYVYAESGPYSGSTLEFVRTVTAKEYKPNGVSTIAHQFMQNEFILTFDPDYYMWDAPVGETYVYDVYNYNAGATTTWLSASRSCAAGRGVVNRNVMYWIIMRGDPRWDSTTRWKVKGDPVVYTGGVWMKERTSIATSGYNMYEFDGDGDNACLVIKPIQTDATGSSYATSYKTAGKPTGNYLLAYHFVPALGYYNGAGELTGRGVSGQYWLSGGCYAYNSSTEHAWHAWFSADRFAVNTFMRSYGLPVAKW